MFAVPAGFAIAAELHRGAHRTVFRASRVGDGAAVILKLPWQGRDGAGSIALRNEYEILRALPIAGVAQALALIEEPPDGPVLVLADSGGTPLRDLIGTPALDLATTLAIGARVADILDEVHRRGIVHRDVNPSNILVGADVDSVRLIDFGMALRIPLDHPRMATGVLEGTVAYMAPEQTGRMNRATDARADLYALGVTLYEMLTGRLPFDSSDALEVIHGHIALPPEPPGALRPDLPRPVGDIVLRLLAKSADDRYQSAAGVARDLRAAHVELVATGSIRNVVAGAGDVPDRFIVPQRLYGREADVARLQDAFDAARRGESPLLMVSGYSGIGKTSLIHELHRALTPFRGHFLSGKCEQLQRTVPYGALTQAFQGLARQLLSEDEPSLVRWRAALADRLGTNTRVILDVIPELEAVTGPAPPVPALGGAEAQNRFSRAFHRLLDVFVSPDRPLVLFLDDLQWADSALLRLIGSFVADRDLRGLIVIGAYRDNEVDDTHPLMRMIAEVRRSGVEPAGIALGPLAMQHLEAFIADTLRRSADGVRPLARLIGAKTGGNPFFVTQFLRALHRDGLVRFDADLRGWGFDLEAIAALDITDNVVDLMVRKIRALPGRTIEALRLAACIGNQFDLEILATVSEQSAPEVATNLWPAAEEGLLIPEGELAALGESAQGAWAAQRYRFLHDRVQQAAYALIADEQRGPVHLSIGRLLLAATAEADRPGRLFEIVAQLTWGIEHITDAAERIAVARLALQAGERAHRSAAFAPALRYLETAAALLPASAWETLYDLALPVWLAIGECRGLAGRFDQAEQAFALLLRHARSDLDRAAVHTLRAHQLEIQGRFGDAIDAAREGLEPLGIRLPRTDSEKETGIAAEIRAIDAALDGRAIAELVGLPRLRDDRVAAAIRLLMAAWAPAYIAGDAGLIAWIPARVVGLSLQHGNTEASAVGYVVHGITVGTRLGDYAAGLEFGRLALRLNDALDDVTSRARVHHLFSCFINPWRRPIAECFEHAREAYRAGLETGDFAYATYACFHETWYGLLAGSDLHAFERDYAPTVSFLRRIHYDSFADAEHAVLQWGRALRGATHAPTSLDGDGFLEPEYAERYRGVAFFQVFRLVPRLHLLYTFRRYDEALAVADEAAAVIAALDGTIWPALLCMYRALTLLATLRGTAGSRRADALARIDADIARLETWADNAPSNFRAPLLVARAERAAASGEDTRALELFEQAVLAAHSSGLAPFEALANERAGVYWLDRGHPRTAGIYLRAARSIWDRWGATAKAAALLEGHADLLGTAARDGIGTLDAPTSTTIAPSESFDLASLMKAAGAIAQEIRLPALLARLLDILIENAGARRGALLLERDGALGVRARAEAGVRAHAVPTQPLEGVDDLPAGLLRYVHRTGERVVLEDATTDDTHGADPWMRARQPRSILCLPVLYHGERTGVLYLENDLVPGVFTRDRSRIVEVLSAHAAIAIRNAELFDEVSSLRDRLQAENVYLQEEIETRHGFEEIVGTGRALRRVLARVEQVAPTHSTVLITGETGTGKELIARAIHRLSPRRDAPFVVVNCGAISPGLVESELFGHEKGAFTGAVARTIGRFELAHGGTLFLDEIGDLPPDLQVRLLRVLQDGEFNRVGGTRPVHVDVRVLAATHRDLAALVADGRFRADLYYRLNVFPIESPPLRDRPEDIPLLVRHFVQKDGVRLGRPIQTIPRETLDALTGYAWPGNVRELRNVIERSLITSTGTALRLADWPRAATVAGEPTQPATLDEVQRNHILRTLERVGWRVSGPNGAARILGIKPTTLEARMSKLGIARPG